MTKMSRWHSCITYNFREKKMNASYIVEVSCLFVFSPSGSEDSVACD